MIKACVFDLDNTLYDYDTAHEAALRSLAVYMRDSFGIPEADFPALYRNSEREQWRHAGSICPGIHSRMIRFQIMMELLGQSIAHAPDLTERYWAAFLDHAHLFPHVRECISDLKEAGIQFGIGTNMTADYQYAKLRRLGILDDVDFIVTSEEAGDEKPLFRLFGLCADKADCYMDECLFVGDDLRRDISGARYAGMRVVWLCLDPSAADGSTPADGVDGITVRQAGIPLIQSLAELMPLIQTMNSCDQ